MFEQLVVGMLNGFVWGMIAALIAIGLTLVFGVLRIVNAAHGEFYLLGALIAWLFSLKFNFWAALLVAPLIVGFAGIAIERGILRPIEDNPIITLIVTLGLMLIIQQSALIVFGGAPQRVKLPIPDLIQIFGYTYPVYRFVVTVIAGIVLILLWIFLYKTNLGMLARASQADRELAMMMGVDVNYVYMITFGIGAALAALAGVLAAPIVTVFFLMGIDALILSFIITIVGGLGSVKGTFLAAILIGEVEGIVSVFASPIIARVVSLLILCVVLVIKPTGMWGEGG